MSARQWPWSGLLLMALLAQLLRWALYLVLWLTIIARRAELGESACADCAGVSMLVRPFLSPFQRALPLVGGFDLSPIAVILIVNVMLIVLAAAGL